jgi:hypothetical protein
VVGVVSELQQKLRAEAMLEKVGLILVGPILAQLPRAEFQAGSKQLHCWLLITPLGGQSVVIPSRSRRRLA